MHKFFTCYSILAVTLFTACRQKPYQTYKNTIGMPPSEFAMMDTPNYTRISIDTAVNFGTVKQGDSVRLEFLYSNEGENLLFFGLVYPSCGCTVPSVAREPVYPGKTGILMAVYHSREDTGFVNKTIRIQTNTSNRIERLLRFYGRVIATNANK
jgi:hypothetical protein